MSQLYEPSSMTGSAAAHRAQSSATGAMAKFQTLGLCCGLAVMPLVPWSLMGCVMHMAEMLTWQPELAAGAFPFLGPTQSHQASMSPCR